MATKEFHNIDYLNEANYKTIVDSKNSPRHYYTNILIFVFPVYDKYSYEA